MSDDTNPAPAEASAAPAPAPEAPVIAAPVTAPEAPLPDPPAFRRKGRRWPMWVAAAAVALLVFSAGVRVGIGFAGRFGASGMRPGYGAGAMQDRRGGTGGAGFGAGRGGHAGDTRRAPGGRGFQRGPGAVDQTPTVPGTRS